MEAVSKGASQSDVKIIGVTSAVFSPNPNEFINVQVHTRNLHERLQKLIELGDGYIILKGGTGTLANVPGAPTLAISAIAYLACIIPKNEW